MDDVNGDNNDGDPTNDPTPFDITPTPSIELIKSVSSVTSAGAAGPLGDIIHYSFTVTNTGNVSLDNIVVNDADVVGLSCGATSLAPGASTTCTATYVITQADVDAGGTENTATVDATDPNGTPVSDDSDTGTDSNGDPVGDPSGEETPDLDDVNGDNNDGDPTNDPTPFEITPTPSIELIKSVSSVTSAGAAGPLGDIINYSFTVTNTGNVSLDNIVVNDADVVGLSCGATSLAPGASTTCTATYVITQADVDAGGTENTATVDATDPNGTPVSDDSDTGTDSNGDPVGDPSGEETPDLDDVNGDNNDGDPTNDPTPFEITPTPSIELIKSVSSVTSAGAAGPLGDIINYSFTVTNTGNVSLDNIVVNDADVVGLSCGATSLAPGASTTCTATYVITQADVDAGGTENTATVDATDPNGTPVSDDSDTGTDSNGDPVGDPAGEETPDLDDVNGDNNDGDPTNDPTPFDITPTPSIELIKSVSSVTSAGAAGPLGDIINYSFTVTNTGNVSLDNIVVNDADVVGLSCGATSLAPGASTTCTATYVITQADVDAGGTENTATVDATDPNGTPVSDDSDTGTDSNGDPVGDPSGEETPDLDDVNGDNNDGDPTNDPTPFEITPTPSIELIKSVSSVTSAGAAGPLGDIINYSFTVTNTGNVSLDNIVVNDADVVGLSCGATSLAPGASTTCTATYVITQADVDAGGTENTATVDATDPNGTPVSDDSDTGTDSNGDPVGDPSGEETPDLDDVNGDNNDGDPTNDPTPFEITPTPSIELIKSVSSVTSAGAAGPLGDIINYSFTVTNTGNVSLDNIVVNDADVVGLSCGATSLAPGASTTCTATYVITQADVDAGGTENTATVDATDPNGTPVSDDSDTGTDSNGDPVGDPSGEETPDLDDVNGDNNDGDPTNDPTPFEITPTPSIELIKSVSSVTSAGAAGPLGDIINYSFTVTNTGNVSLDNIVVNDADVVGLSCGATSLAPGASTTCTATYVITQADVDAGGTENTATVDATDPNGTPVSDDSDTGTDSNGDPVGDPSGEETPDLDDVNGDNNDGDPTNDPTPFEITPTPSIELIKSVSSVTSAGAAGPLGDIINYSFTVTNTGNVSLDNIVVNDADIVGLSCGATSLAPGASTTCTATYVITQADVDAGGTENTATVDATDPNGTPVSDDSDTGTDSNGDPVGDPAGEETPDLDDVNGDNNDGDPTNDPTPFEITPTPSIELIKSINCVTSAGADGPLDDIIHYSFTVTNTGNVSLDNIVVNDADVVGLSCGATSLAPGASTTCTATYVITQADVDAGGTENTATVDATDPNGTPVSDDSDTGTDSNGDPVGDPSGEETPDLDDVNGDNNDGDPTNDPTPFEINLPCRDLTITLKVEPSIVVGDNVDVEVRITMAELIGVQTDGSPIAVFFPISNLYTVNPYNMSLIESTGLPVANSDWTYLGIIGTNHVFSYIGTGEVFPANGLTAFGFNLTYSTNQTAGEENVVVRLFQGSGGECNLENNTDSETFNFSF